MSGMTEDGSQPSRAPSGELERLEEENCLAQQEDCIDNDYLLGSLDLVGEEAENCAVIAIGLCQGKLLVGVPQTVWHRSLSKRRLPPKALSKAVLVAVVACRSGQRLTDEDIVASTKVWIGLLDPQMEKDVTFMEGLAFDHHFGKVEEELALPYGKALVKVANEHFGFVTAESEVKQPTPSPGKSPLEERMQTLEANLDAIKGSLEALAPIATKESKGESSPKGTCSGRNGPPPQSKRPFRPAPRTDVQDFENTSPEVGGCSQESRIAETCEERAPGRVRGRGRGWRSRTYPRRRWICRPERISRLGDCSDQVDRHRQQACRRRQGEDRPNLRRRWWCGKSRRDGWSPELQEELGCTQSSPTMFEGGSQIHLPGGGGQPATTFSWKSCQCRGTSSSRDHSSWLAHEPQQDSELPAAREVVLGFGRSLGRFDGWKARRSKSSLCLMMCAADQAAIDNGNWLMSTVALLEPVPPYQQFANHTAPSAAEAQYSALYDPRWAEIFLTQLKEIDSFVDTKKKLGNKSSPGKNDKEEENPDKARAAAAKAKKKAERAERARAQRSGGSEGGGGA